MTDSNHACNTPDLEEAGQQWTCPVCGRHWYAVLEWDHIYNSDGSEYTDVYRCEFCHGWTRKGYLLCDSCGRQLLNRDGSPRMGQSAPSEV